AIPGAGGLFAQLVEYKKVGEADLNLISAMSAAAEDPGNEPAQREQMHFGLGKAHNDLGEYSEAMAHYDRAHAIHLRTSGETFDRAEHAAIRDRIIGLFDERFFENSKGLGLESDTPIVI